MANATTTPASQTKTNPSPRGEEPAGASMDHLADESVVFLTTYGMRPFPKPSSILGFIIPEAA